MEIKFYSGIICLFLFISVCEKTNAQTPNIQWAKAIGGPGYDIGNAIAVDPESGDVYTTGVFSGTVDFDSRRELISLTSAGSDDIFISKTKANGNFVWAIRVGGTLNDGAYSIAVDESGDVVITGQFCKMVDFDPGPGIFNLTSAGSVDIFILKLDSEGGFIWARSLGGQGYDVGKSLAIDLSGRGDLCIKGEFSGKVDFDPGADTFYLKSADYKGIFLLKLNAFGNFLWAKSMEVEAYGGFGQSVIVDATGNVYTTGWFHGTVDFDPGTKRFDLSATGNNDIFILKLDAYGNFLWAKRMGGTLQGVGISMGVDASGNVYTTGSFYGRIDFDPGSGEYILTSRSEVFSDVFISKLDNSGNFVWAKAMGGPGGDSGNAIVVDPKSGDIYTIGNFSETVDLDPDKGIFNQTSIGDLDVFISKLNNSGHFVWSKSVGGIKADYGYSLTLDASGNVYMAGGFRSPSISFDSTTLRNEGDYDIFLAKLSITLPLPALEFNIDQIEIYPNPTKDQLKIKFDEAEVHHVKITLFTLSGGVVFSKAEDNVSHDLTFDISRLSPGIYVVEVEVNGNKIVKKIVKEQE